VSDRSDVINNVTVCVSQFRCH